MISRFFYLGYRLLLAIIIFQMVACKYSPERKIVGKWKEVSWEYEKVDRNPSMETSFLKEVTDNMKTEISRDLIIHDTEIWEFSPGHQLKLYGTDSSEVELLWKLKGRGNILKLQHEDNMEELYHLQELTEDKMVLHFSIDLQVRGIVKMVFEKIKD